VDAELIVCELRRIAEQGQCDCTICEVALAAARLIEQFGVLGAELAAALEAVLDDGSIATGAAFTALSHWHHRDQAARRG
jgi:hypothetical protein